MGNRPRRKTTGKVLSDREFRHSQSSTSVRNQLYGFFLAKITPLLGEIGNLASGTTIYGPVQHLAGSTSYHQRSILHIPWIEIAVNVRTDQLELFGKILF